MSKNEKLVSFAIGILGLLLVWRQLHTGSSKTRVVPVSTSGSVSPYTPQSPIILQPGESTYDPNTEALTNTPTAFSAGASIIPLTPVQAAGPSAPQYVTNVTYPPHVTKAAATAKPTKRPVLGKGAIALPSGHNKPKAPKGYKAVGQGHGYWEGVPTK